MKQLTFLFFLTALALSAQTQKLADFDGSKPIMGLFDEPMPASFFSQNLQESYDSKKNYTSSFKVPAYGSGLLAYLINENPADLAIVVSGVRADGTFKNHLVTVPANDVLELELSPLAKFDHVDLLALGAFQVQTNRVVVRNNRGTMSPGVEAPLQGEIPADIVGNCSGWLYNQITVSNINGTPGSKIGYADLSLHYDGYFQLVVDYPIGTTYHTGYDGMRSCEDTDISYTYSLTSGRHIIWDNMYGLLDLQRFSAEARCSIATRPGDSCKVPGTNDDARWRIIRSDSR